MKVYYYSYGGDSGGEYEVNGGNEGVSSQEAAKMVMSHYWDDGSFHIVTPPIETIIEKVQGNIVTFLPDGEYTIEADQEWIENEKRRANLLARFKEISFKVTGHRWFDVWDTWKRNRRLTIPRYVRKYLYHDERLLVEKDHVHLTDVDAISLDEFEAILKRFY